MTTIATPAGLWQHLCMSAGLELRLRGGKPGRDADIEEALRTSLNVPPSAPSLTAWLVADATAPAPSVSTEQLLIEVLKTQGGFALMMQDILRLLIIAEARQSTRHLDVEFKFDKVSDPIKNTLEEFRASAERFRRVQEKRPKLPDDNMMWRLSGILRGFLTSRTANRPAGFTPVAPISLAGHADLDSELQFLGGLVSGFISLWKSYGATRTQVGSVARSMHTDNRDDPALAAQLNAATDFWDVDVIAGAQAMVGEVLSGRLAAEDALKILKDEFRYIEWGSVWVESTVQELLDLLQLPIWRRRHELYSVWVGTRLLEAVSSAAPDMHFHPVDGVLSFEFGGSRLASFNWGNVQFDVWAELRSDLVGKSAKRKKGIQPDFRVLRAELSKSANAQTVYVLECKHYLQATTANFVQAASDYARSCPNATVHVVNHGPVDAQALTAALPVGLQAKAKFIGSATPQLEAVGGALRQEIRSTLFPGLPPAAPGQCSPVPQAHAEARILAQGLVGRIELEWDDSLKDMDLALRIVGPYGGVTQSIDFQARGTLESAPFAQLDRDVREGPGTEHIDISAWYFNHYEVIATNYSRAGRVMPLALQCHIVTEQGSTLLCCPEGLSATTFEWKIAELRVSGGVVDIVAGTQLRAQSAAQTR